MNLFRTKPIDPSFNETSSLRRCLTATDLTLFGIGAIIGAGVFVLTGVAAATDAGPAIIISYVIAGLAALFSALSYAELAASIGGCGSSYSYSYASFGEIIAWIIGWDLLLEYVMSVSAVAIGWSGYFIDALESMHIHLPRLMTKNFFEGGLIDLPAVMIILILALLLCIGVRESSRFNAIAVFIKLCAIGVFIFVASHHVDFHYWQPFAPFGWNGIMAGSAMVFFAYIGFDAVSTAAEEALDPQRTLPIGILISVVVCTVIYILVAGLLTSIASYLSLNNPSPVADVLLQLGYPVAAGIVAAGAIAGLTTVILVMYYGLTRIFLAMARDGLLPTIFARIHPVTKTPLLIVILSGILIASIAGLIPMGEAAELVNIGTLSAFTLVCAGVIYLRKTQPHLARPFKMPLYPWIPLAGIFFCVYLMLSLKSITWIRFIAWMVLGFCVYFLYSRKNSKLSS